MRINNGGSIVSLESIVLFPFDDRSIPFQHGVKLHLQGKQASHGNKPVVPLGEEGYLVPWWLTSHTRPLSEEEKNQLKEIYIGIKQGIAQPSRQSKERSNRKNYMNSSVSRMLRKAKANIEATERGEFCITH
ncbi:MAG TPA: hypothetical protein QF772_03225 [Nitrospinaceae bacterium]|jgi:hypothetical protein|nr:hypothetical protein [Gammaproteobacteria bacterium]HJO57220.1 hypothetical protein [Nitrospinaceae bacterium]|tara:strand:- start:221 stop:616 length:396 start_codon:yes stop_codon:yes gene_type:complete